MQRVKMFVCPICKLQLNKIGNKYVCAKKHTFDEARQGYVNLLPVSGKKSLTPGDNDLMTTARREFLKGGYYDKLLFRICEILKERGVKILLDSGCSEGHYTKVMATAVEKTLAFDISKTAVKLGSANDKNTTYFVASAFHIPLRDRAVDCVTKIFAPDSPKEFSRILKKEGILIEVIPAENHLLELKRRLYEKVYLNKIEEPKKDGLKFLSEERLSYEFIPDVSGLENLFKMTPYYYKTPKDGQNKLLNGEIFPITADFVIRIFQKQ